MRRKENNRDMNIFPGRGYGGSTYALTRRPLWNAKLTVNPRNFYLEKSSGGRKEKRKRKQCPSVSRKVFLSSLNRFPPPLVRLKVSFLLADE